jgi:hypothetical protein
MGTEITLDIERITLDWAKNGVGADHCFLFQDGDVVRRRADEIDYDYYAQHPHEYVGPNEAAFVRPLRRVLPRLNLLGFCLESAQAEYEAAIANAIEWMSYGDEVAKTEEDFMTFEEFCAFCGRFKLTELDDTYIDDDDKARGRFNDLAHELRRIPAREDDLYWSERSYFGSRVCILGAYSMLQVFGQSEVHADAEVMWQYGPLVENGWVDLEFFVPGADRRQKILVATEGTSDARILRRAIDLLEPDIADFFRFIDVDERHPFPGTGNLVKFAEGLVRIDIQNQIVFVFDNDAEGVEAMGKLKGLTVPPNMRAMVLPDLEEFRVFQTLGPEGTSTSDINGRAAAMECYLDLELPNRPGPAVRWTNYKSGIDAWQGSLDHKESYMRHFFEQSDDRFLSDQYDSSKLRAVLNALIVEAEALAFSAQLDAAE